MMQIWNPWHGCRKYSEGCDHCYMYYLDAQRDRDGSEIYKTKTNFNLPLKKERQGNYKIQSGTLLHICMTSDFFLEEADEWREEVWDMIHQRPDVMFWIQTKRAERIAEHLPKDWDDGWENVILCVTTENQKRADERLPILLSIPAKHKAFMCAPILSEIHVEQYLATRQFEKVLADGENYDGTRPCRYEWIKSLHDQCEYANVEFDFIGTGNIFIKDGKAYRIPKAYQRVQAQRSGLSYADGCPVVRNALKIAGKFNIPCVIICDTAHQIEHDGAETIVVDKGADSVDFRLVNLIQKGDIAITQDYGLAAMCLSKCAIVINQDGRECTNENISGLLEFRAVSKKVRQSGRRLKGMPKRTGEQDMAFEQALRELLIKSEKHFN